MKKVRFAQNTKTSKLNMDRFSTPIHKEKDIINTSKPSFEYRLDSISKTLNNVELKLKNVERNIRF